MKEKLEKLALAKRRLTSNYLHKGDSQTENLFLDRLSLFEAEDRKNGSFPYDDITVPRITDFYEGKDILITGGTGFVGKVLIEKILRSLPKGGRIFLLIRGRKGLTPQQRIIALLELPIFKHLMTENPEAAERLVAVEGDCGSLGLGLSQADRQTIIDNVSIVFHCAATVRFHLPLSFVALINVRGTREIVDLCKHLKKLDAFVHVSTAYTCATRDRTTPIPEEVIPACIDWRTVLAAAEKSIKNSNKDGFDLIFEKLEPQHPTTYTFCKLLAENLVEEECKGLPAVIVRPSILIATYEDPFGGWIDNLYGPFSFWDGIGRGILRVLYGRKDSVLDHIPVDFHVKILISAAWHRGLGFRMRPDPEKVDVVNNCSTNLDKRTVRMHLNFVNFSVIEVSHKHLFRYPRIVLTDNYWLFWLVTVTSHLPLGILLDTLLKMSGRKPILIDVYRRIFFSQIHFTGYFLTHEFKFHDKWQMLLDARMPKADKDRFLWTPKYFRIGYIVETFAGVIKYVFNETPVRGKESNQQLMYILDCIHSVILAGLGLWIISWMIYR